MEQCSGIRQCLAALSAGELGAISGRALGLATFLRMDMGFHRALGLGSVPLRTLVLLRKQLVLVAWTGLCRISSAVVAGVCLLYWLWRARGIWLWLHWMV